MAHLPKQLLSESGTISSNSSQALLDNPATIPSDSLEQTLATSPTTLRETTDVYVHEIGTASPPSSRPSPNFASNPLPAIFQPINDPVHAAVFHYYAQHAGHWVCTF